MVLSVLFAVETGDLELKIAERQFVTNLNMDAVHIPDFAASLKNNGSGTIISSEKVIRLLFIPTGLHPWFDYSLILFGSVFF